MIDIEWANVITASVISTAISSIASFAVAKHTSKAELKKMKLAWKRKDETSDETAMQNMFAYVSLWLHGDSPVYYEQALVQVALVVGRYSGPLGVSLSNLHAALAECDAEQVQEYYNQVLHLYRQQKK